MAISTIPSPFANNTFVVFPANKTLSITFSGSGIGGLLVTIYGPQNTNNTQSSIYIVNYYTSSTAIKPVLSSTHITTNVSGNVFTFTNAGSYGVRACIMVLGLDSGVSFSYSTN